MIQVLDDHTIDKIAAGEVVEKPASVVKELVENAIDAKAGSITVEISGGGIDFIRVTDDGIGISSEEVPTAFLRHATSKIVSDEDLKFIQTLGFRGEALASIAAVSCVEMITAKKGALTGTRIYIEGSKTLELEEVGAPQGTTIKVSNLFFNTPVRKKFLKSAQTEAATIIELMQQMALSRPDLSFHLIVNKQSKFHTTGNNDLKEVIYKIYGRSTTSCLIPIHIEQNDIMIEGYLGKPEVNHGNRNYENYFVNRRYVKSKYITNGIEEGYKAYMMLHRFPFCVLNIQIDSENVDVNVHPTKMQVRFSNNEIITSILISSIQKALKQEELIPQIIESDERMESKPQKAPEPFEKERIREIHLVSHNPIAPDELKTDSIKTDSKQIINSKSHTMNPDEEIAANKRFESIVFFEQEESPENANNNFSTEVLNQTANNNLKDVSDQNAPIEEKKQESILSESVIPDFIIENATQSRFLDDALLSGNEGRHFTIIGQIFKTYWLIEMNDKLYFLDQHAAHEKIKYEEFMNHFKCKTLNSQNIVPPLVLSLTPTEMEVFRNHKDIFDNFNFSAEEFGGNEVAIRAIPLDFYGYEIKDIFEAILKECSTINKADSLPIIEEKIATMACKAAVKGNMSLSMRSAEELMSKLMSLNNPYHCPHGRPTLISMSKYEIEKKFKRIL